jgi:hypothetical protein
MRGEKRCLQGFGGKIRRKETTSEGVDERIILRWTFQEVE